MKTTKKQFKQHLNEKFRGTQFINRRANGRVAQQLTREYGDYLYSADKEMFDVLYREFLETK